MCLPVQKKTLLDDKSVWKRLGSLTYGKRINRFGGEFKSANLLVNGKTQWAPNHFLQMLQLVVFLVRQQQLLGLI